MRNALDRSYRDRLLKQYFFGEIFCSLFENMKTEQTSGKRIMYSFIWFLSDIKMCYLYLNNSRLVGEHCKPYALN